MQKATVASKTLISEYIYRSMFVSTASIYLHSQLLVMSSPTENSSMYSEMVGQEDIDDSLGFNLGNTQTSEQVRPPTRNPALSGRSTHQSPSHDWQQDNRFNPPVSPITHDIFASRNGGVGNNSFMNSSARLPLDQGRTSGQPRSSTSQSFPSTTPFSGSSMADDPFVSPTAWANEVSTPSNPQPPATLFAVVIWRRDITPGAQKHVLQVHAIVDTLDVGRAMVVELKFSALQKHNEWDVRDHTNGNGWYRMLDGRMLFKCYVQEAKYFGQLSTQGTGTMGGGVEPASQGFLW
ncbi:hypothetical protein NX059_011353 [Plenodomus lindquistii]|nr:hypothetical protein NX059_011353 [Plenodomus lindquistii]